MLIVSCLTSHAVKMIWYSVTLELRDDTKKKIDCVAHPIRVDDYWMFETGHEDREYVPKEAIKSLKIKDYWKK